MEAQLDAVAEGREDWVQMMRRWYDPFAESVKTRRLGNGKPESAAPRGWSGLSHLRQSRWSFGPAATANLFPARTIRSAKPLSGLSPKSRRANAPNAASRCWSASGRFGKFIACTDYPECKTTKQPASAKIDVPCPKCGGEIVQKRSKKGATFFGCANYPKCDFVAWGKPVGRSCPKCQSTLVENTFRGGRVMGIKCHNGECDYKEASAAETKGK